MVASLRLRLIIFATLAIGLSLIAVTRVQAAAPVSPPQAITLSPTNISQTIQPGVTYDGSFEVINQGQTTYEFKVYATPYSVSGEAYEPGFVYTPGTPQVSDWFSFDITNASIQPGRVIEIPYKITVPNDVQPGGYYAVAFAETKVPSTQQGVTLNQRVGEIFYLEVPGPVAKQGNVLSWEVNWLQAPPVLASLRVQNNGGVHFGTTVNMIVTDVFGNQKHSLETKKFLLPQTIRKIDFTWDGAPQIGLFKVGGTATILGKTEALPERYVLVMSHPVRLMLLVAFALVMIIIITRYSIRKAIKASRKKKAKKKQAEQRRARAAKKKQEAEAAKLAQKEAVATADTDNNGTETAKPTSKTKKSGKIEVKEEE